MTIGIDPGITGAIAVLGNDGYRSEDMPVMAKGTKGKRCIHPQGVMELLESMERQTVYLELVHAMPKNGGLANFSMGDSFGVLRAVCAAIGYPLVLITPREWKKYFKLDSDKENARAKAIQLFPLEDLKRKKDHNRAEALLIARYGYSIDLNEPPF